MEPPEARHIAGIYVLLITLMVASFTYPLIAGSMITFDADEASKAVMGLEFGRAMEERDIGDFISATQASGRYLYPFVYAWWTGLFYNLFGFSLAVSRLTSWTMLLFCVPVTYWIGSMMDERRGWLVGSVSATMLLTSQKILLVAGLCMIELTGLFFSLLTIGAYFKALKTGNKAWFIGAGFSAAVTFFTKYNFGMYVIAAILLTQAARYLIISRREDSRTFLGDTLLFLIPLSLCAIWLYFYWMGLYKFLTAQPVRTTLLSYDNIIYYPRVIFTQYTASPVISTVMLVCLLLSLKSLRNPMVFCLTAYFIIGVAAMFFKLQNVVRFVLTVVPALYLLTGLQAALLCSNRSYGRKPLYAIAVVVLLSIPGVIGTFERYPGLLDMEYEGRASFSEIHDFVEPLIASNKLTTLDCGWDQMPPKAFRWYWSIRKGWDVRRIRVRSMCKDPPEDIVKADRRRVPDSEYYIRFRKTGSGDKTPRGYAVIKSTDIDGIQVTVMGRR
ncbi:MAG: glycosyltransferase family 39 protein [Candidatus Altiarchaeota archaeon]